MTTAKDTIKGLLKSWQSINLELSQIRHKILALEEKKVTLISQLDALLKTFELLGERPSDIIIPPELLFTHDASIGDAMEQILKERGALPSKELREELVKAGKIKAKNARIILANATKRDTKKRFRLKDGKISLVRKGNE